MKLYVKESTMNRSIVLALGASISLWLAGCATQPQPKSIVDTAAATPQLSTLTRLIGDAGLAETLRGQGPFTVFAPTDDAFKAVPAKTLDALGKNPALLKSVLSYHVLPGNVRAADVKNGPSKTLQGANIALARSGTFVTVDEAVVTTADVAAVNGVIHIVDRVLMPPSK
jgi:uncharacterized surface protein with fasciclin (FAS1) repeats